MLWKFRRALKRKALLKSLGECDVPPLQSVAWRVVEILRDERSGLDAVARLIEADAALTVKLLRVVNAAAFGLRRRVDTAKHAVAMLGRARVESLVLGLAVRSSLPAPKTQTFDAEKFWLASAFRAAAARALCGLVAPVAAAQAFTAALLQDMAVPLLIARNVDGYAELYADAHHDPRRATDVEQRHLGWHHADAGAWLAESWSFPPVLTGAIGDHHEDVSESDAAGQAVVVSVSALRDVDDDPDRVVEWMQTTTGARADDIVAALRSAREQAEELGRALAG